MAGFWGEWALLVVAVWFAAMSPGPDFLVTVRHAIGAGRRAGVFTALGLGVGVCVHVAYCLSGVATLVAHSIVLFSAMKFLGAAYLFYLGWGALRARGVSADPLEGAGVRPADPLSAAAAFRKGFLTNLLNPKATLFFLALFTQIVTPAAPVGVLMLYGVSAAGVVALWFVFVALVLTAPGVRGVFMRLSVWIDRLCGAFLIFLGVRLALARAPGP